MIYWQCELDVGCIYSFYADEVEKEYAAFKLPKIPLLIAALTDDQAKNYNSILVKDNWRQVGWYPGCHYDLGEPEGNRVILYCKEQDVPPLKKVEIPKTTYRRCHFNEYLPLGCSCVSLKNRPKLTPISYRHRTIGLHRKTKFTKARTFNNWHKFAVTSLAEYWFWGLLPDETDIHKYE